MGAPHPAAPKPLPVAELAKLAAWRVLTLRQWWALWPAAVALDMLVAAVALHLVWRVVQLPVLVIGVATLVAAVFAVVKVWERRQGWPRLTAAVAYAWVIAWTVHVWLVGPYWLAVQVLGWSLVAGWPLWLWTRWWRDRTRFVQVAENRWERRAGAPDPGVDWLASLVRRVRKGRRRSANRRAWATVQPSSSAATLAAAPDPDVDPDAPRDGYADTLEWLAQLDEPVHAAELARTMGANRETVRRHLVWLADRGHALRSGTPDRPLYTATTAHARARARARDADGVASAAVGERAS
jgi:hypothetical protein